MSARKPTFHFTKDDVSLNWTEGNLVGFSPRGLKSGAFRNRKIVAGDLVEREVADVRNPRPQVGPLGIRWPWDHMWEGELVLKEGGRQLTLEDLQQAILKRLTPDSGWAELYGLTKLRQAVQSAQSFDALVEVLDNPPSDWDEEPV